MAEIILKDLAKKRNLDLNISSAGIITIDGLSASENSKKAVEEIGLNLNDFKSRVLNKEIVERADLILTMTEAHKTSIEDDFGDIKKVFTISEYSEEIGDIADPYGLPLYFYEECRNQIENKLKTIIKKIQ